MKRRVDFESLKKSGQQLLVSFGTLTPWIASVPHTICRNSSAALTAIESAANKVMGAISVPFQFNEQECLYVDLDNLHDEFYDPHTFKMWSLPMNQRYLREILDEPLEQFVCLVDAMLPAAEVGSISKELVDSELFYSNFVTIGNYIANLNFAYIPLLATKDFAVLAVDSSASWINDRFRENLDSDSFALETINGYPYWTGSIESDVIDGIIENWSVDGEIDFRDLKPC